MNAKTSVFNIYVEAYIWFYIICMTVPVILFPQNSNLKNSRFIFSY